MLNDPLWALATSHHRSLPPTQRLFLAVQSVWPLPPWHRAIEITLPPLQLSFLEIASFLDVVFHFWFSCSCPLLPPVHSLSRHIAVSALELHLCHVFTPLFSTSAARCRSHREGARQVPGRSHCHSKVQTGMCTPKCWVHETIVSLARHGVCQCFVLVPVGSVFHLYEKVQNPRLLKVDGTSAVQEQSG